MTIQETINKQNAYCNLPMWHKTGYTGAGVAIWNAENSKIEHGKTTRRRILDAAPDATVINATISIGSNDNTVHYAKAKLDNGTEYDIEDFIKQHNIKIITRSVGGSFITGQAVKNYWVDLQERYNLIILNSYGNEGDIQKSCSDDLAILVGACILNSHRKPQRANYSSTGQQIDFCDFVGVWSGTSFAAPYLAGKIALLVQRYGTELTQEQVYTYLQTHCEDMQDDGEDSYTGWGLPVMGNVEEVINIGVKTYSLARDGDKKLSAHFAVKEFACNDGSDRVLIADDLVILLEQLRTYFGKPIRINSAYRTATYNKKIGGASASQHVKGTAADIVITDIPVMAVAGLAADINPYGGVGWYKTFVHVDTRGSKVRWDQRSGKEITVNNFGITETYYNKYKAIQEVDDMVDEKRIVEIVKEVLAGTDTKVSDWAKDAWTDAVKSKITDGTRPGGYATREELITILSRM